MGHSSSFYFMRLKLEDLPFSLQNQVSAQLYGANKPHSPASSPIVERPLGDEPLAKEKGQAGHPARYVVRVCSHRQRLLDEDNLSAKYFCDSLRYAGLLPSDAPAICQIITTQVKVKTKAEQRTEITIEIP